MKLHIQTLTLLIFIFCTGAKAQDINEFYFEINLATNLAKAGRTDEAITTYENAFKKVNYVRTTHLKQVLQLAKKVKDEKRIGLYTKRIKNQSVGTNPKLIAVIDSLFEIDQKVRQEKYSRANNYLRRCRRNGNCNTQSKRYLRSVALSNKRDASDSSNISYLLNAFNEHGYIGEELIGAKRYFISIMLLHFDKDTINAVLQPVLKKALMEGKILPTDYASILDRHSFNHNKTQKYWVWSWTSKGKRLAFSEADIPEIIKLRESIGIYDSHFWQEYKRGYWILRNTFNY